MRSHRLMTRQTPVLPPHHLPSPLSSPTSTMPARCPGRLSCWTSLRPESDQSRTASATRPARRKAALCRSPGPLPPAGDVDRTMTGAVEMRDRLRQIGIESFSMTTGGKGLHVVVPPTPRHGWGDTKAFAEAMADDCRRGSRPLSRGDVNAEAEGKDLGRLSSERKGGQRGMPHATPTITFAVARPCSR